MDGAINLYGNTVSKMFPYKLDVDWTTGGYQATRISNKTKDLSEASWRGNVLGYHKSNIIKTHSNYYLGAKVALYT